MKWFLFPIVFFSCLGALFVFGAASDSLTLAVFFGRFSAIVTDPLIIMVGLVLGAIFAKPHHLAIASVTAGLLVSVYIAQKNAIIGAQFSLSVAVVRIVAVLSYAFVTNIFRVIVAMTKSESEISRETETD